jgi:flavin-dependent dehydrogenase
VTAPGAVLVGDAADFFDPFTGEGICAAFRGAELLEATLLPSLTRGTPPAPAALRAYGRARRRAFLGKWAVERAIGYAMLAPALFDRTVARLERHGLAHTLIGVTGDFVPPRAVLNPLFLSRVVF